MPTSTSWRLYKIAQDARTGAQPAGIANGVLAEADLPTITTTSLESLAAAADYVRSGNSAVA